MKIIIDQGYSSLLILCGDTFFTTEAMNVSNKKFFEGNIYCAFTVHSSPACLRFWNSCNGRWFCFNIALLCDRMNLCSEVEFLNFTFCLERQGWDIYFIFFYIVFCCSYKKYKSSSCSSSQIFLLLVANQLILAGK